MAFDGGSISSGSHSLVMSGPFFLASDVGRIVTVQGAGAGGTTLKTTLDTFTDSSHVTLHDAASTTATAQIVFVGDDDGPIVQSALTPLTGTNGDGSQYQLLLPLGAYLIDQATNPILIPNPQSGQFVGNGPRFGSMLVSMNPTSTAPILQLGNGTNEPHNYLLEKLAIDANGGGPNGALYFNRVNLMGLRDVVVQGLGPGGVGITNPSSELLFQEMIFDRVSVYGVDGTIRAGSVGVNLYATGSVHFTNSNIEQVETGLIFTGGTQAKLTFIGGHIERIGFYAMILNNCEPTIDFDAAVGGIWLGNDVVNGSLNVTHTSFQWTNGVVVDNGWGNRIRKTSTDRFNALAKSAYSTGISFDGDEWLYVSGIVDDPTFSNGIATWSAVSATVSPCAISMPGVKRGASMAIFASGGNGFASRTFTALTNTDYLVQVGILARPGESYRVTVSNSSGGVYDSGNFSYTFFGEAADQQSFKVFRKSIPVATDTTFTVTIYAVNAGQTTICPLLLISKSSIQMVDIGTNGSGFSSSGGGSGLTYIQDTTAGNFYTFKVLTSNQRCFARAVVTVPAGVIATMGVGGDGNAANVGPQVPLRAGITAEYVLPLANYPPNSTLIFYSFSGGGTIEVQDIGVYPINDIELAPVVLTTPDPAVFPNGLSLDAGLLPLGGANFSPITNVQTAPASGNGFKRVIYGSNIFWNGSSWTVSVNGGGTTSASMPYACFTRSRIRVEFTR